LELLSGVGGGKIGMDCSIVPLKKNGLSIISTTDFFFPLVDDPYIQGKIGACNVISDMYALGVVDIDNVLMILAVSQDMDSSERDIVARRLILGFNDLCNEAGVTCTGGQTVFNPWPIIGGTAMSCCSPSEFILPVNAVPGDILILTKPLGTQITVNLNEWIQLSDTTKWDKCKGHITLAQVREVYGKSVASMIRLNRNAAQLMHSLGAHASTDVTGFGIIGHATNLVQNQKSLVNFEIDTLPCFKHTPEIDALFSFFNLLKGYSAETSGGLLIAIPPSNATEFCQQMQDLGETAWIIGKVVPRVTDDQNSKNNSAYIVDNPKILQI